ncbi:LuxR family transcriptional regulator [Nocardioides iriomotensis]|uniref:LuxR family transcriptional regulator n=1 Tax=Nocardioides iriomotensis TaxID=715784 RepID=A0A4Q5IUI6_9ACTN|nr:LuxR family transcriptional regulator [Nocardioides iriomotensis]RYU08828.1 LuxR family transcriptional regulator [Nocardioides iriomotensis]
MGVVDGLRAAREAYERRDWLAAYDVLSDVEPEDLGADDFARLATTAHLLGRRNDAVLAMQRAYQAHLGAGEVLAAVRCGFWLSMVLSSAGEGAVAGGWTARADRLLADVDGDVVERGYLRARHMFEAIEEGRFPDALADAVAVADYGRRFGDPDLVALGLVAQGRMLLYAGDVPAGLRLLDEAMVAVATGELAAIFAGEVYCTMIEGCQEVSDFGRVAEWTEALHAWCEAQPDLVLFTGQCAVHRAQIMRLRGAFADAVDELDRAERRYLAAGSPAPAGLAMAERGDVLRIVGDLYGAELSYAAADRYGHEPQPGRALLRLAQGRVEEAVSTARRLLAEPRDDVHRSQLLPAAVEVLLAAGAVDEAATHAGELADLADRFGCPGLVGWAGHAVAAVAIATGDAASALPRLRRSQGVWAGLGAPYEAARCRVLTGRAYLALGDEGSAELALTAAREAFDALGVPADAPDTGAAVPADLPAGLTAREVEVLRLVAAGRSNAEIALTLVLSEKTVARHLSNIFGKLAVPSRTAAAAYAFEHRLV